MLNLLDGLTMCCDLRSGRLINIAPGLRFLAACGMQHKLDSTGRWIMGQDTKDN